VKNGRHHNEIVRTKRSGVHAVRRTKWTAGSAGRSRWPSRLRTPMGSCSKKWPFTARVRTAALAAAAD
jgi:hypothetical protein